MKNMFTIIVLPLLIILNTRLFAQTTTYEVEVTNYKDDLFHVTVFTDGLTSENNILCVDSYCSKKNTEYSLQLLESLTLKIIYPSSSTLTFQEVRDPALVVWLGIIIPPLIFAEIL